ncbi:hypothetical protein EIN_486020 [Entamoeba invadens IP1]|uniref:Uncharacterized protein n=1 Tax=Entamoeba invadens IP1 TaxID=370355 RepID=A0A0A1U811_ENTIV|nr:hypothetical protein EIN_486020 [Entamoeba invadens IP1]ELP89200.1 hypothetical protein EIN_486020 [Entamoeba invadens IP1]|eukprot:XP_004255971.1 hypothetical protein EIN_486020 [Entamoeba invadens IP1]
MNVIIQALFLVVVLAEDLMLFEDGTLYEGFEILNPDNLTVECEYTKRSNWVATTMNKDQMIVFTKEGTVSTKVADKDKYYKSIRFMVRYDSDDVKEIPVNVKIFNETFTTLYNANKLNTISGYSVKVKKNNSQKMTIKLDNFDLNDKVSTIIFSLPEENSQSIKLLLDQIRLDTRDSQNSEYDGTNENAASSLLCGSALLFSVLLVIF